MTVDGCRASRSVSTHLWYGFGARPLVMQAAYRSTTPIVAHAPCAPACALALRSVSTRQCDSSSTSSSALAESTRALSAIPEKR